MRTPRRQRLREWWHSDLDLEVAPWHRPKPKVLAPGVTVTTTYGSHVMAALLYAAWKKVRRV
jgi:hypothetical protein